LILNEKFDTLNRCGTRFSDGLVVNNDKTGVKFKENVRQTYSRDTTHKEINYIILVRSVRQETGCEENTKLANSLGVLTFFVSAIFLTDYEGERGET
jgi:hypothetical protein